MPSRLPSTRRDDLQTEWQSGRGLEGYRLTERNSIIPQMGITGQYVAAPEHTGELTLGQLRGRPKME